MHVASRRIVAWAALTTLACVNSQPPEPPAEPILAPAPPPQPYADLKPSDDHYGIYLNGHKVGWMRSRLQVGDEVAFALELEAAVGGLGTVSRIRLQEERAYARADGKLLRLRFEQSAATGAVVVEGKVRGGKLALDITAGQQRSAAEHGVSETLESELAMRRLAQLAQVGRREEHQRFDASIQKTIRVVHEVQGIEQRMFAGVTSPTVRIRTTYPELGVEEGAWVDGHGRIIETQIGGFFVARLEPPDVAKKLDYSQDLLVSAVVKPPVALNDVAGRERLALTFAGFGDQLPPASERQAVQRKGDFVQLALRRDAAPQMGLQPVSGEPDTQPTPFIQSGTPAIQAKAKDVVGDAKDLFVATTRLAQFVYSHIRDEYVPAYSNALEALESGRGDCTEHSILFVALARSLGIPARVAVGIAYWEAGGGFGWHAWAEVKAGDRWYAVDPTWNQPIADVSHVKLADGDPWQQARIVMLLGRLRIIDAK